MDLSYSEEYEAFRSEVQGFLEANWPPQPSTERPTAEQIADFRRRAIDAGYLARAIPKRYGGSEQEVDALKATIIREEFRNKRAPGDVAGIGPSMLVPTLLERGEEWMKENGGVLTAEDFARYRVRVRAPLRTRYRGHEIVGFPPPSSGGTHVAQILNILESFDLEQADSVEQTHLVIEAMKLAFADRAHWLGDADHVDVPVNGLVSQTYARKLARRISRERAAAARESAVHPWWARGVRRGARVGCMLEVAELLPADEARSKRAAPRRWRRRGDRRQTSTSEFTAEAN